MGVGAYVVRARPTHPYSTGTPIPHPPTPPHTRRGTHRSMHADGRTLARGAPWRGTCAYEAIKRDYKANVEAVLGLVSIVLGPACASSDMEEDAAASRSSTRRPLCTPSRTRVYNSCAKRSALKITHALLGHYHAELH